MARPTQFKNNRRRPRMFWSRQSPFANAWSTLQQFDKDLTRWFDRWSHGRPFAGSAFPMLNVWEEGETLIVEAELPGLSLDEVEIFVTGQNQLTIKGERKAPEHGKSTVHRQ